jgi:hypothetical protein
MYMYICIGIHMTMSSFTPSRSIPRPIAQQATSDAPLAADKRNTQLRLLLQQYQPASQSHRHVSGETKCTTSVPIHNRKVLAFSPSYRLLTDAITLFPFTVLDICPVFSVAVHLGEVIQTQRQVDLTKALPHQRPIL